MEQLIGKLPSISTTSNSFIHNNLPKIAKSLFDYLGPLKVKHCIDVTWNPKLTV
jgi:hypothetical protein